MTVWRCLTECGAVVADNCPDQSSCGQLAYSWACKNDNAVLIFEEYIPDDYHSDMLACDDDDMEW